MPQRRKGLSRKAGGKHFHGPWGTSIAANPTPDPTSGLGDWNDAEIERAIRTAVARDGHKLFPPMPVAAYQHIAAGEHGGIDRLSAIVAGDRMISDTSL